MSGSHSQDSMENQRLTTNNPENPPEPPPKMSGSAEKGHHSSICKRVVINMGNGRTKQGHRCTVECLARYPIHHAARLGRFKDLKALLERHNPNHNPVALDSQEATTPPETLSVPISEDPELHVISVPEVVKCCPMEQDECLGRTPLHYAACTGNVEKGYLCVRLLLECNAVFSTTNQTEKMRRFVNSTDYNNETALHLAARNEATNIVKELLLNQADLDIKSIDGKCALMDIYKRTPLAMDNAMNQSISYVEMCKREMCDDADEEENKRMSRKSANSDEIDFTHSYVNVCLNFYPLLGSQVRTGNAKNGRPVPETTFLYKINRKRMASQVRRQILNNVLVQAFLHFKWNKVKMFCFFAIFMHVVWLALYIGIVIDVFVINCPYMTTRGQKDEKVASSQISNNDGNRLELNVSDTGNEDFTTAYPIYDPGACELNGVVNIAACLLLLFSVGISVKEIFQFIRLRTLYIRFENIGQCILLAFIFLSTPDLYMYKFAVISPLHYQISAFGIFLAWTLLLCQLAKLPQICFRIRIFGFGGSIVLPDHGIYVEILTRVFKNFLVFITIFSSLLISFVFSFNILLPNSTGFINLSNSVLKVLTMMTGELNYDDIFHSDNEDEQLIYPVSSHVMYAIFIMVATIILFNLLIGFTVSDIQGLQKDAEVNQISNKLEQIFLMECFLVSSPMQTFLGVIGKIFMRSQRNHILRNIMVTRRTQRHTWMCYHTKIKSLPVKHRIAIRDWASKNCLPISDISGVARPNLFKSSFTR